MALMKDLFDAVCVLLFVTTAFLWAAILAVLI